MTTENNRNEALGRALTSSDNIMSGQALIGKTLGGRYLVDREIGRGGIGAIFLAQDKQLLSRFVVVKVLLETSQRDEWVVNKFRHEIEALARIDHPGIVGILDTGELPDGKPYLVMQYVDGVNLRHEITPQGMNLERASHIIREIGRALSAAHDKGILHRDLKPENIMLQTLTDGDVQVKVIDFGIAKIKNSTLAPSTITETTAGTVVYMSPEQLSAHPLSPASDTYSLGVIAYEMATGRRPFNPESIYQLLDMMRAGVKLMPKDLRPSLSDEAQNVILKALQFEPKDRYLRARDFTEALSRALANSPQQLLGIPFEPPTRPFKTDQLLTQEKRAHIFLSYKRQAQPDEAVALQLYESLRERHDVFIDQNMLIGTRWAERIENELRQTDFLLVLLSAQSVHSEMVEAEVSTAFNLAKSQNGRPQILPVRLNYREPFQYPLSAYLNHINWSYWSGPEDTPRLLEEIKEAVSGGELLIKGDQSKSNVVTITDSPQPLPTPLPAAQPASLEMPEGTMDPQSAFYVERPSDAIALATIKQRGVTITIKGPRQMGKSSLLIRTIGEAIAVEKRVVFMDFQLIDRQALTNVDLFFRQFCSWLTDELEMDGRISDYWSMPLGNSQRTTRYVGRYILKELKSPLVLAMDEVESIFDTDFRSDFFSMLRSWHNSRATSPLWKQLDLVLVTSTEPYQLIENLNQSPFNVGQVIELSDFTIENVNDLNQRHENPLNKAEVERLMNLLGGHPYLVRRALYLVASKRISSNELFSHAVEDRGPFGDHLRYHLFRIHDKPELVKGMQEVTRNKTCRDEKIFFRLRGAGLVRRIDAQTVVARCQLYADYFREHFNV